MKRRRWATLRCTLWMISRLPAPLGYFRNQIQRDWFGIGESVSYTHLDHHHGYHRRHLSVCDRNGLLANRVRRRIRFPCGFGGKKRQVCKFQENDPQSRNFLCPAVREMCIRDRCWRQPGQLNARSLFPVCQMVIIATSAKTVVLFPEASGSVSLSPGRS